VSDNYFKTLGIHPALGRVFTREEAAGISSSPFAVISDRLWKPASPMRRTSSERRFA
jgi:hypothetical protein